MSTVNFVGLVQDVNHAGTPEDFFRSNNLTDKPDGTNDTSEAIRRTGNTGFGDIPADPVAKVDIAQGARSGVDSRVAGVTPFYATGALPQITILNQPTTPTGGAEIKHSNQTQGIGFAYNGIYASGSNADQDIVLLQKGAGAHEQQWQGLNASLARLRVSCPVAASVNTGFIQQMYRGGAVIANWYSSYIEGVGPLNVRQQWDITSNGTIVAGMRLMPDMAEVGNTTLYVGENRKNNRKIVLWDGAPASQTQFYGFGINGNTLRYQTDLSTSFHRFYGGTTFAFEIAGNGAIKIPVAPVAAVAGDRLLVRDPATGLVRLGADATNPGGVLAIPASRAISADQNNIALTAAETSAGVIRFSPTGNRRLTGIVPPATGQGTRLIIMNMGPGNLNIMNTDTNSTVANRFVMTNNLTVNAGQFSSMVYVDGAWRRGV